MLLPLLCLAAQKLPRKKRTALLLPAARGFQQIQPLSAAMRFAVGAKIESTEELRTYKARLTHELEVLTQKRKYLYNHKEALTPDVRNRRLEELSARMRTVRRELNTCADIETDAAALQLKWQEVRQAEKEEREVNENEQRRRSR